MGITYRKLWHLLLDRNMKRKDLEKVAGISHYAVTQLGKDKPVSMDVLCSICAALNCELGDIIEMIPNDDITVFK